MLMLQETYKLINDRLFDGELPECHIVWLASCDGWMDWDFGIHGVAVSYPEKELHFIGIWVELMDSPTQYFNTFVHECIHIWQAHTGRKMNHGKTFKHWCRKAYEEFYE